MVIAFFLSSAAGAAAERRTSGLEAFGGMIFPVPETLDRGLVTGFGFTWPLARYTRVGVHFLYASISSRGEADGLLEGRLTLTPFLVFLRQDIALGSRLAFHLAGGGGILFARLREDVITIPEVTISQHLPNSAALHASARLSLSLTDSLALFVQGGYLFCRTTGTTTIRDMNLGVSGQEFTADLSSLHGVAGLVLNF